MNLSEQCIYLLDTVYLQRSPEKLLSNTPCPLNVCEGKGSSSLFISLFPFV